MHTISLRSVSYTSAQTIFQDLSLELSGPGWIGLVGANGTGKTTLLRLISGELAPEGGSLKRQPKETTIFYCEQGVEEASDSIFTFAQAQDSEGYYLRGVLQVEGSMLGRWSTLSPGERKRWQIGAALYLSPDILLLDEPTNHIDQEGKRLLLEALRSFSGLGLLVSHDRELLCELTSQTARCTPDGVTLYRGNYEQAREQWEAAQERKTLLFEQAKTEELRLKKNLQEQRERLQSAEKNQSSKNRMKSIKDHDARSAGTKFSVNAAASRISRGVSVTKEKLQTAESSRESFQWQRQVGRSLFVSYKAPPSPWITRLETPTLKAGEKTVLEDISLALRRREKIWLKGDNGTGKTTLLRALYQESRLDASRIFSLPQELSTEEAKQLIEKTRQLPSEAKSRVLSLLAALGVEPERMLRSQKLSHGEARKLALSYGLGAYAWALFLDEPTNHLDLPSIERLEEALAMFPGALLLISHDAPFAARCTQKSWEIKAKKLWQ